MVELLTTAVLSKKQIAALMGMDIMTIFFIFTGINTRIADLIGQFRLMQC
jgi:hypothetical protein